MYYNALEKKLIVKSKQMRVPGPLDNSMKFHTHFSPQMGAEGMEGGASGSLHSRKLVSFTLSGRCLAVASSLRVCSFNAGHHHSLRLIWSAR
jgi:hypothetical protein